MGRYIDADWLESEFNEANEISFYYLNADSYEAFKELKKIVEQAPSIDIVHCGECAYRNNRKKCPMRVFTGDNGFCCCGERKGE